MRVLGIITARGGSKGVPGKNLRSLGGKPLIAWTVEAALGARLLAHTVLTTDDNAIAAAGRAAGIDVPFMRPPELALDTTPSLPVVQHAVRELEARGDRYDAICLLQPTNPLRTAALIDRCVEKFAASTADSLVTILPIPAEHNPYWAFRLEGGEIQSFMAGPLITRRQELPAAYHREGAVYLTRRDVLLEGNSLYGERTVGVEIDPRESVNIDTLADWARAEQLVAELR
ncbi:MAG TPA: acylneuraminate cytidylyltransferase family protein [Kofleriaceae bacterium]